jgi:hypothetical protein
MSMPPQVTLFKENTNGTVGESIVLEGAPMTNRDLLRSGTPLPRG